MNLTRRVVITSVFALFLALPAVAAICNGDDSVCCVLRQNPCRYECSDGTVYPCPVKPKPKAQENARFMPPGFHHVPDRLLSSDMAESLGFLRVCDTSRPLPNCGLAGFIGLPPSPDDVLQPTITPIDLGDRGSEPLQCDAVYLDSDCNDSTDPDLNGCVIHINDCCCRRCSEPGVPLRFCSCIDCAIFPASFAGATGEAMLNGKFKIRVTDGDQSREMSFQRDRSTGKWLMDGEAYEFNGAGFVRPGAAAAECAAPICPGPDCPSVDDFGYEEE